EQALVANSLLVSNTVGKVGWESGGQSHDVALEPLEVGRNRVDEVAGLELHLTVFEVVIIVIVIVKLSHGPRREGPCRDGWERCRRAECPDRRAPIPLPQPYQIGMRRVKARTGGVATRGGKIG